MIPTAVAADPAPPPPHPPPQPPRSSFSCDKHPDEQFNGFCPSCLCERLVVLDQSSSNNNNNNHSSSSRRPSTSSSSAVASIKSLFSSTSKPSASIVAAAAVPAATNPPVPKPLKPTPFFPELRRTKSFCASKHEAFGLNFSGAFEPQRKSCDVRLRNSLWSLFTQDDESKINSSKACTSTANQHPRSIETNDSCVSRPVLESKEEDEEEESEIRSESDEIAPVVEEANVVEKEDVSLEIVQEDEEVDLGTMKPMKDHIDNDAQVFKKPSGGGVYLKEIAGSLLSATSVFSKKWQKWRQKQKQRKRDNRLNPSTSSIEKPISRHYRETQSEVADYGFGRRSCDTDPRFSLDAGRISFDDPRYSLDEPRASWDGYFMNGRSFPRMIPPMLSVVEDAPVVTVARTDAFIPVEEPPPPPPPPMDDFIPGGSAQTNEYYSDSSSRRRKSLDRSSSIRKTAAAVVAEMDDMKAISNGNVLPNSTVSFQGTRDTNSNCISKDYYNYPENFHLGGFRNNGSVIQNREANGTKMSRRWSWRLWGFIRSSRNKDEDEDEAASSRGVERSFSESWQDLRRKGEGNNGGILLRSNSSVSWRHSNNVGVLSSSGNVRKLGIDINGGGYNRKKKGDECVLERNKSARYSPNNTDNGLLRFYLTPMRNSRRNRSRRGVAVAVSATKK